MKGYIYTMFRGADPGQGWQMSDPVFHPTPTIGACVPNIRRAVVPGDYIFCVSGRVPNVRQYVVGGFRVADKIDALAAYERFPENRLRQGDRQILGNVIVDKDGRHHPLDEHSAFSKRVENYIVGTDPIVLEAENEVEQARLESLAVLSEIFERTGEKIYDVIGRARRLNENQIDGLIRWMSSLKAKQQ